MAFAVILIWRDDQYMGISLWVTAPRPVAVPEAALAAQLNPMGHLIGRNWTVKACLNCCKLLILLVRPEGLEPPTLWFEARCSIQLSYGRGKQGSNSLQTIGKRTSTATYFAAAQQRLLPRRSEHRHLLHNVQPCTPQQLMDRPRLAALRRTPPGRSSRLHRTQPAARRRLRAFGPSPARQPQSVALHTDTKHQVVSCNRSYQDPGRRKQR